LVYLIIADKRQKTSASHDFVRLSHAQKGGGKKILASTKYLYINQLAIYDLHSPISDVVHPADSLHRIGRFQCLRDTFRLGHLFYHPREHFLRLMFYVGKVTVQLAAGEEGRIDCPSMLLQVTPVALSPYADGRLFFFGQFQIRKKIIPNLRVSTTEIR